MAWLVSQFLTSEFLLNAERQFSRLISDQEVDFFHCPTDAHSHVALLAIRELVSRPEWANRALNVFVCREQKGYEAQSPEQQFHWALRDSRIALKPYQSFLPRFEPPTDLLIISPQTRQRALEAAVTIVTSGDSMTKKLSALIDLGDKIFSHSAQPEESSSSTKSEPDFVTKYLLASDKALHAGHYLAGMVRFGREWFWGLDRLGHLEHALQFANVKYNKNRIHEPVSRLAANRHITVQLFYSFRSPYSQICLPTLKRLANEAGFKIKVNAVLPMVMRGLQVPLTKRMYIIRDCAREARDQHIPFGRISDPVGKPTERAFVALHFALQEGKEFALLEKWADAVWARGVNAGSDAGLEEICVNAGLDWATVQRGLTDKQTDKLWREYAEANRVLLYKLGLWGVPSFCLVDADGQPIGNALWGQDRLFEIQNQLSGL